MTNPDEEGNIHLFAICRFRQFCSDGSNCSNVFRQAAEQ